MVKSTSLQPNESIQVFCLCVSVSQFHFDVLMSIVCKVSKTKE